MANAMTKSEQYADIREHIDMLRASARIDVRAALACEKLLREVAWYELTESDGDRVYGWRCFLYANEYRELLEQHCD